MSKFALGVSIVTGIALVIGMEALISKCSNEINLHIGEFDSETAGVRSSIQKLAAEIDRCPKAELYRIIWIGPGESGDRRQRSLVYYRTNKAIGYEADAFSGTSAMGFVTDDTAIRAVAKKGGTLEDFAEYDKKSR